MSRVCFGMILALALGVFSWQPAALLAQQEHGGQEHGGQVTAQGQGGGQWDMTAEQKDWLSTASGKLAAKGGYEEWVKKLDGWADGTWTDATALDQIEVLESSSKALWESDRAVAENLSAWAEKMKQKEHGGEATA